jgi:hypothetical protein
MAAIRLAPLAVLRAPAWPVSVAEAFGDGDLGTPATGSEQGATIWRESYHALVSRERLLLARLTVEDPRFMKALFLSTPALASRARHLSPRGPRHKRERHLETALFRYLMRAAGRPAPFGGWAGVAPVRWAARGQVCSGPARWMFAPDLRPFQALLRALASTPPYRQHGRHFVNATLQRINGSRWRYDQVGADGRLISKRLCPGKEWRRVLKALPRSRSFTIEELAAELAPQPDDRELVTSRLVSLAEIGIVCPCLDLPKVFTSIWEALEEPMVHLLPAERPAWRRSIEELRALCAVLERDYQVIGLDELEAHMTSARRSCQTLAAALGIPEPSIPHPLLRADLRLPIEITLDERHRDRLGEIVADRDRLQEALGLGVAFRRARLRRECVRALSPEEPVAPAGRRSGRGASTWEAAARGAGLAGELDPTFARWREVLVRGAERVAVPLPAADADSVLRWLPPVGCVTIDCWFGGPAALGVSGVLDHLGPTSGRLWKLLAADGQSGESELTRWLRETLDDHTRRARLQALELVSHFPANPNVQMRPEMGFPKLDLIAADGGSTGPRLVLREGGVPLLSLAGRDAVAFSFTGASVKSMSPRLEELLLTTFQDAPDLVKDPPGMSFEHELDGRRSPEVCLGEARIRRARWVLSGPPLQELLALRGADRFAAWWRLARAGCWPALLLARRNSEAPLLFARDSALGVEALFEGAEGKVETLLVEEPPEAWLTVPGAGRFLAELHLFFERPTNAWTATEEPREDAALLGAALPWMGSTSPPGAGESKTTTPG